jgi:hypothetical protein
MIGIFPSKTTTILPESLLYFFHVYIYVYTLCSQMLVHAPELYLIQLDSVAVMRRCAIISLNVLSAAFFFSTLCRTVIKTKRFAGNEAQINKKTKVFVVRV